MTRRKEGRMREERTVQIREPLTEAPEKCNTNEMYLEMKG